MASDYIELNPGTGGDKAAADTISTVKHPRVKVQYGATGSATDVSSTTPLPVSTASSGTQNLPFFRHLDTTGDGTGTTNANGNYSSTQGIFRIAPPASTIYRVSRMLIGIEDSSGMTANEYGNLGSSLTNGIQVRIHDGTSTIVDMTDGAPVTTNAEWGFHCYDVDLKTWGGGNEFMCVRWTFTKTGQFIRLDGDANEELQVLFDDNLTGLINHSFIVHGYTESTPT